MTSVVRGSDNFDSKRPVWQDVLSGRASAVPYTNNLAYDIEVSAVVNLASSQNAVPIVAGFTLGYAQNNNGSGVYFPIYFRVGPGESYQINISAGGVLVGWKERR